MTYTPHTLANVPDQPKTPQMNFRLPPEQRAQFIAIAKARNERDLLGSGASAALRRYVASYITRNKADLPDDWRDYL